MSSQPAPRRNFNTHYRRNTLIIAAITAVSTALLVIPAWRAPENPKEPDRPVVVDPKPGPTSIQTPEPVRVSSPLSPPAVCGRWRSVTSQKNYDFVCQGQSSFQIRELNGGGQDNTGSGSVGQNGEIKAELLIGKKDRTAHLRLQLSSDGQRLDGTWHGDDARESGTLSFYRVP